MPRDYVCCAKNWRRSPRSVAATVVQVIGCIAFVVQDSSPVVAESIAIAAITREAPVDFRSDLLPILQRNCLSCHMMDDGELPGNSGPPLLQMQLRFPDRQVLRQQIWDAAERNPNTIMPPYGRHHILTEAEVNLVVDYVHSL